MNKGGQAKLEVRLDLARVVFLFAKTSPVVQHNAGLPILHSFMRFGGYCSEGRLQFPYLDVMTDALLRSRTQRSNCGTNGWS